MTNEEKHKLLDAVIEATGDNMMGGKYYKAYKSGVINAYNRLVKAIKELEQGDAIDKISSEILDEAEYAYADFDRYKEDILHAESDELPNDDFRYGMERAVEIINKYRKGGVE